ncbi:substrate-binding domain-containing protein [Runella sp. MFBS21]|uniref:substrate-binding domain-containing protein n=1 Tax=Runella sp. MFBS21 TaxID=3034018 RepID=UPI0023F818D5|nr:substrate-binding domain-containing protein [Runella sp. MFBS21]MDF7821398.1 substrate-binding domain-containing protein [Runella sp. MFBS21]
MRFRSLNYFYKKWITGVSFGLLLGMIACSSDTEFLRLKGSDTEVNLSVLLAEAFYKQNQSLQLSVSGGGSGLGIAALMNGLTDIANSSRPMNLEEERLFKEKKKEIIPYVFAHDAIAIVVHASLPLDSISVEALRNIFSGKIRQWTFKQLPMTIYGRQSNSGTHSYLKQKLGIDFSLYAKEMNGNAQIIEAVKADKGGIGYAGAGYVIKNGKQQGTGFKILKVYEKNALAYSPLDFDAVVHKKYYFQRPLYQYILKSSYAKALPLLTFEKSIEGQKIIINNGYFPADIPVHE